MKNLITRGASGIIYIALILFAVLGAQAHVKCSVLFSIFAFVGAYEFFHMTRRLTVKPGEDGTLPASSPVEKFNVVIGILCTGFMVSYLFISELFCHVTSYLLNAILILVIIRWILTIFDSGKGSALLRFCLWIGCLLYIGLTLTIASFVPANLLLATFVLIWVNDTGAFCVGSLIGKHKMSPRLSPKKSWEGFGGGIFFCLIAAFIFHFCNLEPSFSLLKWLVMGVYVGVLATWGDLFESLIKRNCGVKDSGKIIPGHGGILDRLDSFLMAGPLVLLFF